jgi:hypothetical protein
MKDIELFINDENFKGKICNSHQIELTQNINHKYFEDWLKIPITSMSYQDVLANREYKKVIKYICEKEDGILSGCYPILDNDNIIIHYDMKIGFVSSKNND